MKRLLLATTMLGALVSYNSVVSATTLTGTYTATLTGGDAALDATNRLPSPFSLTLGGPRSLFLQVDPNGTCYPSSACNPVTGTITVTFSNLTANGHNFGGFTETGTYKAYYGTQEDEVDWTGATVQSGFGTDQEGLTIPLVFTDALNGGAFGILDFNLVDGADWNVQTYAEASLAAVPGPIVGAGLPGLVAGCFSLIMLARRRKRVNGH